MDPGFYRVLRDVQATHWWYAARRTILERVLAERVARGALPEGLVYDLGCGVGANLRMLGRFGRAVGVDSSPEAVAFCRQLGDVDVREGDVNDLSTLPAASAKVVLLADILEHLDDESPCLSAVQRLLAPGGILVATVPAHVFLWGPSDEMSHHRRRYRERDLRRVIARFLDVEHITYFNSCLFPLVAAGRLLERALRRHGGDFARVPPAPVNGALRRIFALESRVVPGRRLPVGVSILCVARKRADHVPHGHSNA